MTFAMSNALLAAAAITTQPAEELRQEPTGMLRVVLAAGVCALVVSLARCIIRPERLRLAGSPGRPNRVNPFHLLVLFLLWVGLLSLAMYPADIRWQLLAQNVGELLWLFALLATGAVVFPLGLRRGMGLSARHWAFDAGRAILSYLAVLPVCYGILLLSVFLTQYLPPEQAQKLQKAHPLLVAISQLSPAWQTLAATLAVLLAPVAEEVFFRGFLQSMLRRYAGPWPAVIIASCIFAGMHVTAEPLSVAPLVVLGVALGYSYERTGRLLAPILMHCLFNAMFLADELIRRGVATG